MSYKKESSTHIVKTAVKILYPAPYHDESFLSKLLVDLAAKIADA
jgi:hypothetical protein